MKGMKGCQHCHDIFPGGVEHQWVNHVLIVIATQ